MSESDGEHAARSVALEQAYVHEVYEQCAEKTTQSKHWPRVYQFLQELEPGALVCDIGCGNGKYLSVNHSIFKIGVDRCKRFTDIAREKENEVLICDNLALPFREESFDAVLSIAVVHHFATTERRVHALKELARVLRIGGRLVISVWAMEQKHRKFESQDVLIPWPKSYCMSAASDGSKHSDAPDGYEKRDENAIPSRYPSSSKRNSQRKCKSKSYWIDPIFSLSPSTSSLSSPNETCYSCFRRALQKLARSRRGGGGRAWFPGSWQSSAKSRRNYDPEDTTDVDELPIELRRVETARTLPMTSKHSADTLSIKSKSLGDILEVERLDLVRSRSSIPGFCSTSELILDERSVSSSSSGSKPRLVKQKSYVEEAGLDDPEDTAIENLIRNLPDFPCRQRKRNVPLKQSSMNEELMSAERLEERERVRRNIMKQASLNEELICKWRTFEALKDSISPVNAGRRFQLLKNGFTSKIRRSTTNIEKVSGISIKNGFVRMLQGWKSSESDSTASAADAAADAGVATSAETTAKSKSQSADGKAQQPPVVTVIKRSIEGVERRLSREDGSDSSKDSSLQSDTSVDSEDSIASVIFVPKQDAVAPVPAPAPPSLSSSSSIEAPSAPRPAALQLGTMSAPPSPRVKQPPPDAGQSSRFKLIGVSSLLKQQPTVTPNTNANANTNTCFDDAARCGEESVAPENPSHMPALSRGLSSEPAAEPDVAEPDTAPLIRGFNGVVKMTTSGREAYQACEDDQSRRARLNQIKELLIAKPGFATRARPSFPLVRRASTAATGRLETVTRILPRLLSLELFNPETDDLDSDSSGVSSPESVGSVISVTSDERYIARREAEERRNNAQTAEGVPKSNGDDASEKTKETETESVDNESSSLRSTATLEDAFLDPSRDDSSSVTLEDDASSLADAEVTRDVQDDPRPDTGIRSASRLLLESGKTISAQSMRLLEAAANVASSLEDAVGTAIKRNTQLEEFSQRARGNDGVWTSRTSLRARAYLKQERKAATVDLGDYTDESSSDLMRDISRYCQNSFDFLEVRQDVAGANPDANADAAPTCRWDGYDQVPEETSWIVNEAYDGSGGGHDGFANALRQPKLTPKSKSLSVDYAESSEYKIELAAEPETRFVPKYDETFRFNPEESEGNSKAKFDLVNRSNPGSNGSLTGRETFVNPRNTTLGYQRVADSKASVDHVEQRQRTETTPLLRSNSDDALDFVMVSKTGEEFECEDEAATTTMAAGKWRTSCSQGGLSMDSSDVGDSLMENTTTASLSDSGSRTASTARLFTGSSTVSLASNPHRGVAGSNPQLRCASARRRTLQERGRSLDETRDSQQRRRRRANNDDDDAAAAAADCLVTTSTGSTLSNASSQESLPSDRGGGSITYHQYYHVFREGELDQLINKYVENLHIISSYYDHASWCVVAEKVQVWTI